MEGGEGLVWHWDSGRNVRVSLSAEPLDQHGGLEVLKQDVSERFFQTLRVRLLQGSEFGGQDRARSQLVAVVNQTRAQHLWPNQPAVAQTLFVKAQPFQVVGVSTDLQPRNPTHAPEPHLYLSYWQSNATREGDIRFGVRVAGELSPALREIRRAVQSFDPNIPVGEDMLLSEQVGLE